MALPARKTYLLITALTCLIHFGAGYTLIPGIAVGAGAAVPPRLEIRTCIQDPICLNIYLLALESIQTASTSSLLSHYRISGIHGTNFAWDGDTGGNYPSGLGYCYHGHRLFTTWHRPYLSLYEKALYDAATQIVQGFTDGDLKNRHIAALNTWRLPYWDWAMDASLPTVLGATTASANVIVMKMQSGQLQNVSIRNPLYSYRLQISNDPSVSIPQPPKQRRGTTVETVRSPVTRSGVYVNQPTATNNLMIQAGPSLRSSVVRTFSNIKDYNAFSSMADNGDSIEGVHGTVHVTVANFGHMRYVEHAAFDPIFYLHHANIDRLFAMWQAIYPNSYITNSTSASPNENTPLVPFRKTDTEYWTSKSSRDTKAFGYTYPELIGATQQSVITAFNNLYGGSLPVGSGKRKRRAADTDGDTDDILTTYNDYVAHIKIANNAARTSFPVCLFLGEPITDPNDYASDPNYVGCFKVFTRTDLPKSHKKIVRGTVAMNTALYNHYAAGKLQNMERNTLKNYLKDNLKWKITADQTEDLDLDGYEIIVEVAKVKIPNRKDMLPIWEEYSSICKIR